MGILGIIGGSGLYDMPGLEDVRHVGVESPFGAPSDLIIRGRLGSVELAFLPRHGLGHRLSPDGINYRANIDCLKRLGVTDILSLSACGSLREDLPPGDFVLVDQFIDRTRARPLSYFGNGLVAHISMAEPTCARLRSDLAKAAEGMDFTLHPRGTYLVMEGPQFSTRAESHLYRQWGADLIGMTNLPEAKLAREAEMCYLTIGMVTDYDCWREGEAHVDVESVLKILMDNASKAQNLVAAAAPLIMENRQTPCPSGCDRALEMAIVTHPDKRDAALMDRLDAVAGRVLKPAD
ncbi:S-methyl-5'-thioadenosine phosphorylase [Iodidimonas nitroreducens]|uniref:S-methyl-5'-thioadenosine phosphorylase n=1 Tax=Iodidimonas nitroreducens TaxID=1236968 RepID=A0A5A7N896_9PROT|nr:S-methyl-5'-thioadenosine phosphorylase [Iodidimonas nitroreducens]GAK34580.1 S-methyl-5'-thioadenosine phosphorylase [alpha proteobacterium Q-1]GER03855.1 S-methyl-5'-thioadenosine phosphorylase [Iodidimonas nitroreducens]